MTAAGAIVAAALAVSARAERAGKLDEALAALEDARARLGDGVPGARVAAAVLAVTASRLALAAKGPEPAREMAEDALAAPAAAWSVRAAAELAAAAAHLREHGGPGLDAARAAIARAVAGAGLDRLGGWPDRPSGAAEPDEIDELTAKILAQAGAAGRFAARGSLGAHALELRGLCAARAAQARRALDDLDAAYRLAEGDPDRRARVLLTSGIQLRNWGLLDEALRRIERSLELRLQLDDLHGAAICEGVIAFVHQRRGDFLKERDALAADLRLCERIGSDADVPGLRARLAGALIGLGKYAAAWAEAEAAITGEEARREGIGEQGPTRIHGFGWREQARVRLAEGRLGDATARIDLATGAFTGAGDAYGIALCDITRAQIALARVEAAPDADALVAAIAEIAAAKERAAPVLARLGALPDAAELALVAAEARALAGDPDAAAAGILERVVPALVAAGLGETPLCKRARQAAERLSSSAARADLVARAASLPALAGRVLEDG